jgi:hypothetical protein
MKLKKFNRFVNEELLNTSQVFNSLEQEKAVVQKQLDEIEQLEEKDLDEEDYDEIIETIETATPEQLPEIMKKTLVMSFKLMRNANWRNRYKTLLRYYKKRLDEGLEPNDAKNDVGLKKECEEIEKIMPAILNVSKEEMKEISDKFFGGIKKYNDSMASAKQISAVDPLGEEVWDDLSDEERIRNSFKD